MLVCQKFCSVAVGASELWNTLCGERSWEIDQRKARMTLQARRAGVPPLILLGSGIHLRKLLVRASTAELKSPDDQCNQSASLLTHLSLRMSKHQQLFRVGSTAPSSEGIMLYSHY
jgi:hypothetical protein